MPELRRDLTTGRDVVVASERARRPDAFRRPPPRPGTTGDCPFCPGHEDRTPPATVVIAGSEPGTWRMRVVPNKYAAFRPDARVLEPPREPLAAVPAVGRHEVIIETPDHRQDLADRTPGEAAAFLRLCRKLWRQFEDEPATRAVLLFRNRGPGAGASLDHPHSQIVAMPLVPPGLRLRLDIAAAHHRRTGEDLYGTVLSAELNDGRRVIALSRGFAAFAPYASAHPFESWIVPRRPFPRFTDLNEPDLEDLAEMLVGMLRRLDAALGRPDCNWVLLSAPAAEPAEGFRWHFRIIPRLTVPAGFEYGAEMNINVVRPEEAARLLRDPQG